jgi:hypothetical protein
LEWADHDALDHEALPARIGRIGDEFMRRPLAGEDERTSL